MKAAAINDIDPLTDPAWESLHVSTQSTLFSSPLWLRAVADTYGLKPLARVAFDHDHQPLGGIAYCSVDDPLGERIISFPFSDFQDPVGNLDAVAEAAASLADPTKPIRLRIPDNRLPALDQQLFPNVERLLLHHIVTVTGDDADTQFAALHSQVRQNIRKARRAGIEVELRSDLDAVRTFYDLHVGVRTRKYRLLPQPFSFFESLHATFAPADHLRVALAVLDGRPVAGIIYIECGSTLYYKFNASDVDGLKVRPNELLVWAGIEHCIERGLTGIDLGVSDTDQPGLIRYKRKFAQFEQEVATITGTAAVTSPQVSDLKSTFGQLTKLLTDPSVPADISEQAGAVLYRYFV